MSNPRAAFLGTEWERVHQLADPGLDSTTRSEVEALRNESWATNVLGTPVPIDPNDVANTIPDFFTEQEVASDSKPGWLKSSIRSEADLARDTRLPKTVGAAFLAGEWLKVSNLADPNIDSRVRGQLERSRRQAYAGYQMDPPTPINPDQLGDTIPPFFTEYEILAGEPPSWVTQKEEGEAAQALAEAEQGRAGSTSGGSSGGGGGGGGSGGGGGGSNLAIGSSGPNRLYPISMVRINGVSITDKDKLLRMSVEHTESGKSGRELKLVVANPALEMLDDPNFQEGKIVEWRFGYHGNLTPLYEAKIYAVEPSFDPWSGFTLTFYAYNAITRLAGRVRQKVWRKSPEAELTQSWVVEQIAKANNLQYDIEETKNYVTEIAQSSTDWEFLNILARDSVALDPMKSGAYRVWIDSENGILHFKPAPNYMGPKKTYEFFTERDDPVLISFTPKLNIQRPGDHGAESTTTKDVDGKGTVVDEESKPDDATRVTTRGYFDVIDASVTEGEAGDQTAGTFREDPISSDPVAQTPDALDRGDVALARDEESAIEVSIVVVGDPQIVANDVVEVTNVGRKFSGNYIVNEVRHLLNESGYITEMSAFANTAKVDDGGELSDTGGIVGGGGSNPDEVGPDGQSSRVSFNVVDYEPPTGEPTE